MENQTEAQMHISKRNVQTEARPANHLGPKPCTLLLFVLCSYRTLNLEIAVL